MKRQTVFFQLFLSMAALLTVAVAASGILGVRAITSYAYDDANIRQWALVRSLAALYQEDSSRTRADSVREFVESIPNGIGYRLTVMEIGGRVLADTHQDPQLMDDHSNRPEVIEAIESGRGSSQRRSATLLGEPLIYTAYNLNEFGLVFRVARTVEGLDEGVSASVRLLAFFSVVLILATAAVSLMAARRIGRLIDSVRTVAQHYSKGDFSVSLDLSGFREADDLSKSLNRMGRQLQRSIQGLDRRRAELQAMLEGMTAPVVLVDSKRRIKEINPAALDFLGLDAKACRGKKVERVLANEELTALSKGALSGRPGEVALALTNRDGHEAFFQVTAAHLGRDTGKPNCLLVMNDITQIKRLEKVRKDFVANVSHELRTPITSIMGFVETLQNTQDITEDRRRDFMDIIHRHTNRLQAIINDLLALSRLEEGAGILPKQELSALALVNGVVDTCRFKAESKSIAISIDVPPDLDIEAHPVLIEQSVVNLVENAVKYSPEGTPVRITVERKDKEVIILVEDKGPGLPEDVLERVFERFYRVDKARSRDMGGTGLGLAIVKHVALKHGGRAWVESRPGEGCRFYIAIPS